MKWRKETRTRWKIGKSSIGPTNKISENKEYNEIYRAVLDFGILDVDVKELHPKDDNVEFVGTTSDMTVYSLGSNISQKSKKKKYNVGNIIKFDLSYIAVARLLTSKFVKERVT